MKLRTCRIAAFATAIAIFGTSLAPVSPASAQEPSTEGFDPSAIPITPAPQVVELLAFDMNRVVTTQMRFIRYEATAYQRKVAEARARAYVAAQRRAIAKARPAAKPIPKPTVPPKKPKAGEPKVTKKTDDAPEPKLKEVTKPKEVAKPGAVAEPKPLPRYIAVDTVKDKRASPKAKKVVMIWDTHAEALVGNNIYDVEDPPAVGTKTKFETYSAEYIGAGL